MAAFTKYETFLATLGTQEGMAHRSRVAIAAKKSCAKLPSTGDVGPSPDSVAVYKVSAAVSSREADDGARGNPTFNAPFSRRFKCAEDERCGRGAHGRRSIPAAAPSTAI